MSGKLFDRYGAIVDEDVEVLEACLNACVADHWKEPVERSDRHSPVKVCEIGMHDGATGLGIMRFLAERNSDLEYWGIDPDPGTSRPRSSWKPGYTAIIGDSAEVFSQVPAGLDLVWVDGCHCFNHVVLDTLHYAPKIRLGGFICFHDANPAGQGQCHQYHGPDIPEFGLAVNQALDAISFGQGFGPLAGFNFFKERYPTDRGDCGTRAYRRIA